MSRKIVIVISILILIAGCTSIRKTKEFSTDHPANSAGTEQADSTSKNYMAQDYLEKKSSEQLKHVKEMPEGSHHHEGSHH